MYSESELQWAVAAGAITGEPADARHAHVETLRSLPPADEENVRLITGFSDIFVSIACGLAIFRAPLRRIAIAPLPAPWRTRLPATA